MLRMNQVKKVLTVKILLAKVTVTMTLMRW